MNQENEEINLPFNREASKLFTVMLQIHNTIVNPELFNEFKTLLEKSSKINEDDYDAITTVFERMTFLRKEIQASIDEYRSKNRHLSSKKSQDSENTIKLLRDTVDDFISILDAKTEELEMQGKDVKTEDIMSPEELEAERKYTTPMLENEYRSLIEETSQFLKNNKDISSFKLPSLSKARLETKRLLGCLNTNIDDLTTAQKDTHDTLQRGLEELLVKINTEAAELVNRKKAEESELSATRSTLEIPEPKPRKVEIIQASGHASVGYSNPELEKIVLIAKTKISSPEVKDLISDFNPKDESKKNMKNSRILADKIGIHARSAKLKRKIYLSQLFGVKNGLDKFKPKLEGYISLLEKERNLIQKGYYGTEQKEKIVGIFNSELAYCNNLLKEFSKDLSLDRRARRAAKLVGKNSSRKATDLFQRAMEKFEMDSSELHTKLYETTAKTTETLKALSAEDFLKFFKKNMDDLKNDYPELYKNYLLTLFYQYRKERMNLNDEQENLLKRQPELAAEIIDKLNIRGLNISRANIVLAKLLQELQIEPEDYEQLQNVVEGSNFLPVIVGLESLVDPIYNILNNIDQKQIDLSGRQPIDIITDANTTQKQQSTELFTFIQSNFKTHEDLIKGQLSEYKRIQEQLENALPLQKRILEKRLEKIEKSVTKLLGLRQLNDTLKSEILLNIAMSDNDQKLQKLGDHSTVFAISIGLGVKSQEFSDPATTTLLQKILIKEAKRADQYSTLALDKQVGGKNVSAKRAGANLIKQWAVKKIKKDDEDNSPPTPSSPAPAA